MKAISAATLAAVAFLTLALPAATTNTCHCGLNPVGNRTNASYADTTTNLTWNPGYTSNDCLTAHAYDDAGNTLGDANSAPQYAYDWENPLTGGLVNGKTISIMYDGDGNRVRKTVTPNGGAAVTTRYLVDDRNLTGYAQVIEESDGSGQVQRMYGYRLDLLGQVQALNGQWVTNYYGYDGLGSVRLLTDGNGAVTDTYTYDPYGNLAYANGQTPNLYLYTGEQMDPDLGMYYLRARYYQPELGRFWNLDSFEGWQEETLSLHKYLYARNNPANRIDPSGHEDVASLSITMGIQAGLAGSAYGAYSAHRTGGNVWAGAGVGFAAGFAGGYFLGPLPAAAFQTKAAIATFSALAAYQINNAINLAYAGYYDLAFIEGAMGFAIPFALRPAAAMRVTPSAGTIKIFRGVHGRHPRLAEARNGEAVPLGGHADPAAHNFGDVESVYTSWSTDRSVAAYRARLYEGEGQVGVVLELQVPRAKIIDSPDVFEEAEILLRGRFTGATVTNP